MRPSLIFILFIFLTLIGCSGGASKTAPTIYTAGDKATVGALVYNLTDAESTTALGDDPANLRTPLNRFYLIRISVSNSGADEQPIPSMSLVDDSGQMYPELADGTGVTNWLGVVRKVAGAQTEQGMNRKQLLRLIREAGREPVERDTAYNRVERTESAFAILV